MIRLPESSPGSPAGPRGAGVVVGAGVIVGAGEAGAGDAKGMSDGKASSGGTGFETISATATAASPLARLVDNQSPFDHFDAAAGGHAQHAAGVDVARIFA